MAGDSSLLRQTGSYSHIVCSITTGGIPFTLFPFHAMKTWRHLAECARPPLGGDTPDAARGLRWGMGGTGGGILDCTVFVGYGSTHTYTHTHTHTCTHTHTRTHRHTHYDIGLNIHTHTNTYTHVYINIHTHIHTCTYTYTHTRAHTHTDPGKV